MKFSVKFLLSITAIIALAIVSWVIFSADSSDTTSELAQTQTPSALYKPKSEPEITSSISDSKLPREEAARAEPDTPQHDLADLIQRMSSGQALEEEQIAFWELVRTSPEFDAMISDLEAVVNSPEATVKNRLDLAELYVMKIFTASSDPIRGIWGAKAHKLWHEVLVEDPTNWKAQHSIAYSLSQYPDFLNKTGESIAAYEKLVEFPASESGNAQQASAFNELSHLYLKTGRPADARIALEKGIERYPDHEPLQTALNNLLGQFVFDEE